MSIVLLPSHMMFECMGQHNNNKTLLKKDFEI